MIDITTEEEFDVHVVNSEVPVLVDMYAEWCMPCKMMMPMIEQLSGEIEDAIVVKVNVGENVDIGKRYNVSSVPTFLVFVNGEVVERKSGMASPQELKSLISNHT
jgi:thioredoxin 1